MPHAGTRRTSVLLSELRRDTLELSLASSRNANRFCKRDYRMRTKTG
jgi:hypothetical protein